MSHDDLKEYWNDFFGQRAPEVGGEVAARAADWNFCAARAAFGDRLVVVDAERVRVDGHEDIHDHTPTRVRDEGMVFSEAIDAAYAQMDDGNGAGTEAHDAAVQRAQESYRRLLRWAEHGVPPSRAHVGD